MQKTKIFSFDIEVFNARVHVFHYCSDDEIREYLTQKFPGAKYERSNNNSATAFVLEHQYYGQQYAIDFILPLKLKDPETHKVISHESTHVAWEISQGRDLRCGYESQETFAYIVGYIVRKIYEEVFK
jgi:hypothetical protein